VVRQIRTIDAHSEGEPLRLVIDGFPAPVGRSMLDKSNWAQTRQDHLRRALMHEPRGHADMYGAILTESVLPGSHAGVLFMNNQGFSPMCGHGIIAVTTIALERGLLMPGADGSSVVYDTPAGTIRVTANIETSETASLYRNAPRVTSVTFHNVPSFVVHAGLNVRLGVKQIRADVAFGGAFYALVDSEAVGLPMDAAHLPELRRAGLEIKRALEKTQAIVHPLEPGLSGIYGTIFTAPSANSRADLRNVAVFADGQVDRSPCGTGTSAVMAVLDAMGLLAEDQAFVNESLIGTTFSGRLTGRTRIGDHDAIMTAIEGSAWISVEHTFWVDDDDPLKDGF
jgi:proline racemase